MNATENRLWALIDEHIDLSREAGLDGEFSEVGVSSMDALHS